MVPSSGTFGLTYWPITRTRSIGAKLLRDYYCPHRSFGSCGIVFGYIKNSSSDQNTKLVRSSTHGVSRNGVGLQHCGYWWRATTKTTRAIHTSIHQPSCRDYYNVLGLCNRDSSTLSEIKKAYYCCVKKFHPDKNEEGDVKEKTKLFQEVQKAYEVLKDEKKRSLYDRFGYDAFGQDAAGYGGGHFDDGGFGPFEATVVCMGGGYDGDYVKRGHKFQDSVGIELSRTEAVEGCTKIVTFRSCSYCETCSSIIWPPPQLKRSNFWCDYSEESPLAICDNSKEEERFDYCRTCKGKGVVTRSKTMSIKLNVTPGVNDNDKLLIDRTLSGEIYIVTIKVRKDV